MQKYSRSPSVEAPTTAETNHVQIRHATPDDLPGVLSLEQSTPAAAHWSGEQYRRIFHDATPSRTMLVAEEGGVVLGFVAARRIELEWEIENIAVAAEKQRRGLGRSLVGELSRCARLAHATSLLLEVRESNVAARGLYEKLGFVSEGRRKNYYRAPKEDAVLYRLRLA
jgi:ribosomal-protein-alanine acetyltransferase